jgi:tRNA nucleotidyltransferase (CCA-adding enzyme)
MEKMLKEVLQKITPTREEHIEEHRIVDEVTKRIEKFGIKPILVGSMAKGTDIRGSKDIDIFILFHKDVSREELEKKGLEIGKKVFSDMKLKTEIDYAEHPYVKGTYKNYVIEIVPCYDTKEIKSAVDRTPYHTHYVKKKITENPAIKDDTRLLKQFMKAAGVYGAEAKIEGFSGYLTELLVIDYGSFTKVLTAASGWKFGEAIDPEKLWDDRNSLKYFFTNADFIIVDPVDRNRNAAAAVSKQKLSEFIIASRNFLEKPGIEYFFPKETKPLPTTEIKKRMMKRVSKIIALSFKHKKINENTLYSQLRKTTASMKIDISHEEFRVMKTGFWTNETDESIIILELEVSKLPRIKKHNGPPIDKALPEQKKFLDKYKKYEPYIEDNHWTADIPRTYSDIKELLPQILKEKKGFGKNLLDAKIKIIEDLEVLKNKDQDYQKFLSKYFTPN